MTSFAIAIAVILAGCHTNISLGDPKQDQSTTVNAATCAPSAETSVVASLDPALGELRALAAREGLLVAAFARQDGGASIATVASQGSSGAGGFKEIAHVGADPVAMVFDGKFIAVASQASSQVARVRLEDGVVAIATSQFAVSSIAFGEGGRAFWTRPTDDAVMTWDFVTGSSPSTAFTFPRAQSVASDGTTLYVAGGHELGALGPADAAPRRIAPSCGGGALSIDRGIVFCIDDGSLLRIDAQTGGVIILASGIRGATDVVVARGRAFFRTVGANGATIEAVPIDGIGGPSVMDVVPPGPSAIASDGCGLYYAAGSVVNRRAL